MPAYECSTCQINYPADRGTFPCPICKGRVVWASPATESPDWEARVLAARGIYRAEELPPINHTYVTEHFGKHWIAGAVLERDGYEDAQELDIIRVKGLAGEVFFELVGKTSTDIPGTLVKGWMVERVNWEGAGDKLTPEMFTGGG